MKKNVQVIDLINLTFWRCMMMMSDLINLVKMKSNWRKREKVRFEKRLAVWDFTSFDEDCCRLNHLALFLKRKSYLSFVENANWSELNRKFIMKKRRYEMNEYDEEEEEEERGILC